MRALLSPHSRTALVFEPGGALLLGAGSPASAQSIALADAIDWMAAHEDLSLGAVDDLPSASQALSRHADRHEALDLALIALDSEMPEDLRIEAQADLDSLLADSDIYAWLIDLFHVRPLPGSADPEKALAFARIGEHARVRRWLETIAERQPSIVLAWSAWNLIPDGLFASAGGRQAFLERTLGLGAFASVVGALTERQAANARFVALERLQGAPGYREIMQAWLRDLGADTARVYTPESADDRDASGERAEARAVYEAAATVHSEDPVAKNGRAEALKATSRLPETLAACESWTPVSAPTNKAEILRLLTATGDEQQALFRAAGEARHAGGQSSVKLRGTITISNYCQKSCGYCAMRPQNRWMTRFRMDADTIVAIANSIVAAGISTVLLQSRQDPCLHGIVCEAIPRIRELGVNVQLNLGERSRDDYFKYAELGACSYILKFETSDPELYERTVGSSLADRLQCVRWIRDADMQLGTGNIVGLPGQTLDTLCGDILLARELRPDFVSSSPFLPSEHTPLESCGCAELDLTLNVIAICRLLFPSALIPAVSALRKLHDDGQLLGLNAGANVMTINFTPKHLRDKYSIYSSERFVIRLGHARDTVARAELRGH